MYDGSIVQTIESSSVLISPAFVLDAQDDFRVAKAQESVQFNPG